MTNPNRRFGVLCGAAAGRSWTRYSLDVMCSEHWGQRRGLDSCSPARCNETVVVVELCLVVRRVVREENGEDVDGNRMQRGCGETRWWWWW